MFIIEMQVKYRDAHDNVKISPTLGFVVPFKWLRFYEDSVEIFDKIVGEWLPYKKDRIVYLKIERKNDE